MKPKGLAYYQAHHSVSSEPMSQGRLDVIMQKAALYNMVPLQNKKWLEEVLRLQERAVSLETTHAMQRLLLWLESAQEGALMSR